jgi:outer membrane protein TolC
MSLPDFSQTVQASPESEAIVQAWPKARWWQDFHNPELNRLVEMALQGSPNLRAATARLNQAQAGADYQAAEMLPSMMGGVDVHKQRFSETDFYGPNGGKTFFGANLDLLFRYHLDLWGKDRALLDAALGKERAQASELAMVKLMLSTSIARSYFRLCGLEQASQMAQTLIEQNEAKLHLSQLRWQQGLETQDAVYLYCKRS